MLPILMFNLIKWLKTRFSQLVYCLLFRSVGLRGMKGNDVCLCKIELFGIVSYTASLLCPNTLSTWFCLAMCLSIYGFSIQVGFWRVVFVVFKSMNKFDLFQPHQVGNGNIPSQFTASFLTRFCLLYVHFRILIIGFGLKIMFWPKTTFWWTSDWLNISKKYTLPFLLNHPCHYGLCATNSLIVTSTLPALS